MFLFLLLCTISICGAKELDDLYIYIDTKECEIPIPKTFNLIYKKSIHEYKFSYIDKSKLVDNAHTISVYNAKADDYNKIINMLDTFKKKILSISKRDGFTIISSEDIGINQQIKSFHILANTFKVQMLNTKQEEVDYLINHCIKTLHPSE